MFGKKKAMIDPETALAGRTEMMPVPAAHFVNGHPIQPPFPEGIKTLVVAMGCFWGAEKVFWQLDGVYSTAVGYAGGYSPNPTYREVCSGQTGHTEVVLVAYDPDKISFDAILKAFWEGHDPTQGMRQGNDVGTQYRSAVYVADEQELAQVEASRDRYQAELSRAGFGAITTELGISGPFYYAEDYHQQYLAKNVNGYCGIGGTGVSCPTGLAAG
ncbi:MAG: peptide-methionine (S)-S-oxide reductase MsrA [Acidimicrobiia bacterium]|nr:peptide-methionine (S)-S-oxide reductase MsrA [Acidimicrobiia bacterium]MDH5505531.1 peptide-methionine (S)-S-oxide reductase MsrA [Acidimicrobiia bacterium]